MVQPDGRKKILIVEDDSFMSSMLERALEPAGYHITHAASGKEALRKAVALKPDLILLDIVLPDLDGLAVLKKLRQAAAPVACPIFMLSNLSQPADRGKAKALGASRYLVKSNFSLDEVAYEVKQALAGK